APRFRMPTRRSNEAPRIHQPVRRCCFGMVACSTCAGVGDDRANKATTATTLPQIEMARVKPVDRMSPNLRLSDNLIDLMKDFSLSSAQAIGGAWETPLPPPT